MINFYPFLMKSCAWRLFQILEEEKMINIVMMTIVQIISKHVSTLSFIFDPLSSVYTNQMPMVWPTNLLQNILETLILILDLHQMYWSVIFHKTKFPQLSLCIKEWKKWPMHIFGKISFHERMKFVLFCTYKASLFMEKFVFI
jgi:hypothetical protein